MHPDYYSQKRGRGAQRRGVGCASKVIMAVGAIVGVVLFLQQSLRSRDLNAANSKLRQTLQEKRMEIDAQMFGLSKANAALGAAQKSLDTQRRGAEEASGAYEAAAHKCDNMRAQIEADQERELTDKMYDWKEAVFTEVRQAEERLEEDRGAWEAQLKPIREQVGQLTMLLQSHRIDLAKTEVSRVMHRVLGQADELEAAAFFKRLTDLNFNEPFTVTQAVAARLNAHKGLWAVAPTGEKKALGAMAEALVAALPVEDVIGSNVPRSGRWGSCAVVGNSGILKKYRLGKDIDLHDAIFRLDNAPTDGFQEYVGAHTTVRVVADAAHVAARLRPSRELVLQLIDTRETLEEFVRFKTEQHRDGVNVHMLSPEFAHHLSKFMLRSATQGFLTLALALHKCKRVDVYGFSPTWRNSFAYRYWDAQEPDVDIHKQQGAMRDPDGVDFLLMSELARLSPEGAVNIVEPCLTPFAAFSACEAIEGEPAADIGANPCGVQPLSESATCLPDHPLPQPKPGFCSDSPRKMIPANCFRRCPGKPGTPGTAQCAGDGEVGPACEAVGVSASEGVLVGSTCPVLTE
eukprot:jgi/Tetstr1/444539/TSEL_032416.t1